MATLCSDIIRNAMIELEVLEAGGNPTASETTDCQFRLQAIVDRLFGHGTGSHLADLAVNATANVFADQRVLLSTAVAMTLTFPAAPLNGQRIQVLDVISCFPTYTVTLNGNGRLIEGLTTKAITAGATWLYTAASGNWQKIATLLTTDPLLFNEDEFFTLELAKRIAPMFGAKLTQEAQIALIEATNRIKARFRSTAVIPCDDAVRYLSRQSYSGWNLR